MTGPYRVAITDFLEDAAVESPVLDPLATVDVLRARDEVELAERIGGLDALIVYHEIAMIGAATLDRADRCRGIVRAGVGYNNVDLDAAGRRGIVVCNVPDYGTEEVADHAILLLLAVARQLIPAHEAIRAGGWEVGTVAATSRLRGRTLGLVGCGRIGTATALRAKGFGLDVVIYDPFVAPGFEKALGVRRVDRLEDLLRQSPMVSLHCYLDATTRHLIDARALALMPPGGILVNTARGPIVDQEALLEALDSGRLLGAGIDVVEVEPLGDDRLRRHPRVVLTPHAAFYSVEGFVELRRKAAEEVRRLLLGEPPRCPVNRECLGPPRARLV